MTLDATPAAASPLAIICGGGSLPRAVAEAVDRTGRRCVLFAIRGWAEPAAVTAFPHHWIDLGRYGRFRRLMQAEGCRDVVFIGTVLRPSVSHIRLDWETIRVLPDVWRAFHGGDNHLLSGVGRILGGHGYRLIGAHEVAPDILVPEGPLGRLAPSPRDRADIALALGLLRATSPFDVGQGAVVADRHVLALEAAEGTDRMLDRIADLRQQGRIQTKSGVGVLVKAAKVGQDRRFDLPTIGPKTVEGVARAGLAGLAVVAGATIMAEPQEIIRQANATGVFAVGVRSPQPQ
jgi:DUF1009 family protein